MVLEVIKCDCGWSGTPEEVMYGLSHNNVICPKCHTTGGISDSLDDVEKAIAARRGKVKLDPKYSIDKPL